MGPSKGRAALGRQRYHRSGFRSSTLFSFTCRDFPEILCSSRFPPDDPLPGGDGDGAGLPSTLFSLTSSAFAIWPSIAEWRTAAALVGSLATPGRTSAPVEPEGSQRLIRHGKRRGLCRGMRDPRQRWARKTKNTRYSSAAPVSYSLLGTEFGNYLASPELPCSRRLGKTGEFTSWV